MSVFAELRPEPPQWALDVGLPAPLESENFSDYCLRIGFDPERFLEGLTKRTICFANMRLAHRLEQDLNEHWRAYVWKRCGTISPDRRRRLAWIARNFWPKRVV